MVKQLLLILFAICVGYIFIELQRFLSGIQISCGEWIGFFMFIGVAIWFWIEGKKMDKKEEKRQRDTMKETIKETLEELNKGEKQ